MQKSFHPGIAPYDQELADRLKANLAQFSAFKEAAFAQSLREALIEQGKLLSWKEFQTAAQGINTLYNRDWLKTEYHQTVAVAKSAADFRQYQADQGLYPNLRYAAVLDERTRAGHRALHGLTAPVNHPVWKTMLPPNDWGCRCEVLQTDDPVNVDNYDPGQAAVREPFQNNPALSGEIFTKNAPYAKALSPEHARQATAFGEELYDKATRRNKKEYDKLPGAYRRAFFDKKTGGYLAIHKQRIIRSQVSKNEKLKFEKETRMATVYARNGFRMQLLEEHPGTPSPDALANGIPAELKSTASHNNIVKAAKKAIRKQGAQLVLFEFTEDTKEIHEELLELKRQGIKTYYYFSGKESDIYEVK